MKRLSNTSVSSYPTISHVSCQGIYPESPVSHCTNESTPVKEWRNLNLVSDCEASWELRSEHCHTHRQHVCAKDPGGGCDEVPHQHGEARKTQGEEAGWAVSYDCIQDIL